MQRCAQVRVLSPRSMPVRTPRNLQKRTQIVEDALACVYRHSQTYWCTHLQMSRYTLRASDETACNHHDFQTCRQMQLICSENRAKCWCLHANKFWVMDQQASENHCRPLQRVAPLTPAALVYTDEYVEMDQQHSEPLLCASDAETRSQDSAQGVWFADFEDEIPGGRNLAGKRA